MKKLIAAVLLISIAFVTQAVVGASWQDRLRNMKPKNPTIVYDRYEVKRSSFNSTDVDFIFILDNPNNFGLSNVYLDYEFFLKGQSTATGKNMKFNVKAKQKTELRIPMNLNYVKVFKSSQALLRAILTGQKSIPFRFDLIAKIDLKVFKVRVPAKATGSLPLPKIR